jgi:hypothetical protein
MDGTKSIADLTPSPSPSERGEEKRVLVPPLPEGEGARG